MLPAGGNAFRVDVGDGADLDEDGRLDVVVANGNLNTIGVYRNQTTDAQIADCDTDGIPDECQLVVANDCEPEGVGPFLRGDCDGNGVVGGGPTEAIGLISWAFRGGEEPPCLAAYDAEANGAIGVTDGLRILQFAFLGRQPPDAPFPDCTTSDAETDAMIGCSEPFCGA